MKIDLDTMELIRRYASGGLSGNEKDQIIKKLEDNEEYALYYRSYMSLQGGIRKASSISEDQADAELIARVLKRDKTRHRRKLIVVISLLGLVTVAGFLYWGQRSNSSKDFGIKELDVPIATDSRDLDPTIISGASGKEMARTLGITAYSKAGDRIDDKDEDLELILFGETEGPMSYTFDGEILVVFTSIPAKNIIDQITIWKVGETSDWQYFVTIKDEIYSINSNNRKSIMKKTLELPFSKSLLK